MRNEIRGSQDYLIVGVDVSKEQHTAFFGTSAGKTLHKGLVFKNNLEGFRRLLLQAESAMVQYGLKKGVFGVEPTANYHKPLGEYLQNSGRMVVIVSNEAVKKNRSLLDGRWDKHDTKDAANIADLIAQGKCLYYERPSKQLRDLRNYLSFKRKLKKLEHGLKVRMRNQLVAKYFPELDELCHWAGDEGISIVRSCLNPAHIAGLEYDEFLRTIQKQGRTLAQQKRLTNIWRTAPESIGCEGGPSVEYEAGMLVHILAQVRRAIVQTDIQIGEVCRNFPEYESLLTIPGFGPSISAMTQGVLGDPFRFQNGAQVLKMVGLDLSSSRSGKNSDSAVPSISKKGKADLRYAICQAAMIASSKNKYFLKYFTEKLRGREKEKGIKTKIRIKIAAKMLIIAWTLMKTKEVFDPKRLMTE
jgi:transposase